MNNEQGRVRHRSVRHHLSFFDIGLTKNGCDQIAMAYRNKIEHSIRSSISNHQRRNTLPTEEHPQNAQVYSISTYHVNWKRRGKTWTSWHRHADIHWRHE